MFKRIEDVSAAYQCRAVFAIDLPYAGGDVADGESDATLSRCIGRRAVDDAHVVQRHFTGLQYHRRGFSLIDLNRNFLPPRQQVILRKCISMRNLVHQVAAWNDFHRATGLVRCTQRHPRGDNVRSR